MTSEWKSLSSEEAEKHELYGVGGWLLLFAVGLILALLKDLGAINSEAMKAGLRIGELFAISHPAISFVKIALAVDVIVVLIIYWMMFTKAPAFRFISSCLLLGSFPFLAVLGMIDPFDGLGNTLGMTFLPWLISCGIWVSYLNKSRRVRITFEHMDKVTPSIEGLGKNDAVKTEVMPQKVEVQKVKVQSIDAGIEEVFWAKALEEVEGPSRRAGLWARSFAQAKGDETQAKVAYLNARVGELAEEHLAELHAQEETLRKQEEEKRLAALTEAERAYELLSKGKCPNCSTVQPLSSNQCSSCGALFGKDAWNLLPIGIPPNQ